MPGYNGIIERYRERLPIAAGTRIVSLGEGGASGRVGSTPRLPDQGPSRYVVVLPQEGTPGAEVSEERGTSRTTR